MGDPQFGGDTTAGTIQPLAAPGMTQPIMPPRQPLPKQLTAAIKSCTSLVRLVQLCQAHQAVLNPIHIAAIITKLPKLDGAGSGSADMGWNLSATSPQQHLLQQLLQQLLPQLKAQSQLRHPGSGSHSPRGVANIVWALAKLQCAPDAELRVVLLDSFIEQLQSAVPQDISNVLWGVAKLTKERAPVLCTSASSMQQPPAEAAGTAGPLLTQAQVQLLLQHLCQQVQTASVQTISNSLWAVVVLQQEYQWCMCSSLADVQTLVSAFCAQPQQALPGHIQPIIRCMAQLATTCSAHAGSSWLHWQPPLLQLLVNHLASQREQLELHHVSSVLRDLAHIVCLHMQLQKAPQDQQQGADRSVTPSGFSSASSVPSSMTNLPAASAGGLEGLSAGRSSASASGLDACSSTASSSSVLGSSVTSPSAHASAATGAAAADDVDEVLARLAMSGGPQDASSAVLALAMLRSQLQQLGLQAGVAALCSLLPPAALPHLDPDIGQRLLAAAREPDTASACSPGPLYVKTCNEGDSADAAVSLPATSAFAARVFAEASEGLPCVPVPLAIPGSVSSSAASSPTDTSPPGLFTAGSPSGAWTRASLQDSSPAGPGVSNSEQHNPGQHIIGQQHNACVAGLCCGQQHNPGSSNPGQQQNPGISNPGHSNPSASNPGHSNPGQHNPAGSQGQASGSLSSNSGAHQAAGAGAAAAAAVRAATAGLVPGAEAEGADTQEDAAARQLTHNVAYADSVFQLAEIFTAHAGVMDMIHITACITRLSKVLGTSPTQAAQQAAINLMPLLGEKLLAVLPRANARSIANVLWGYGRLRALPQVQLLPPLVEAFLGQLPNAACRDSAVVLWSLARMSEASPEPGTPQVPAPLLHRLGCEVMQQLAAAAQEAQAQPAAAQAQPRQQQQPGTPAAAGSEQGRAESQEDTSGPPSSRDISNSLMALARLGFTPEGEDSSSSTAGAAATGDPSLGADHSSSVAGVSGQLQGLSLSPGSATGSSSAQGSAGGASKVLKLPVPLVKAVVDYLLTMAATAKTLDLQETATALKQLGLRELHAKVAAAVMSNHGTAHASAPGHGGMHGGSGMPFMQYGGQGGRMGQMQGRTGMQQGQYGGQYGMGQQYSTANMLQQRRQQGLQMTGQVNTSGWWPGNQAGMGGGALAGRQIRGPGGYMGGQQGPAAQMMRQAGVSQQQHAYMLPGGVAGVSGVRHGMAAGPAYQGLAGPSSGVGYGGSPVARQPVAGGYGLQYGGDHQQQQPAGIMQQQQQPPGIMQQQGGGGGAGYGPAVQYMLLTQQAQQQGVGGYGIQQQVPQQVPQQRGGEYLGVPVLQEQGVGELAPPGLVGAVPGVGAAAGGQAQYYLQATSTPALIGPGVVGQEPQGVGAAQPQQQQLFMQGSGVGAGQGIAGMHSQFGAPSMYQASTGMLAPEAVTSTGFVVGDMFLGASQQQGMAQQGMAQQGSQSQLQLLQQQLVQPAGLYQQQQGFQAQEPGALYLQQAQQQQQQQQQVPVQQQQVPMMYGVGGQGHVQQPQQQQFAAVQQQAGSGSFVYDPSTGMYHMP